MRSGLDQEKLGGGGILRREHQSGMPGLCRRRRNGFSDAADLRLFFKFWCSRRDYLDALMRGEPRRNLDGSEAGPPTPEQQEWAAVQIFGKERAAAMLAKIAARAPEAAA